MTSQTEKKDTDFHRFLTVPFLARIGATCTLLFVLLGATLGRMLQEKYKSLVSLIPYVGVFLLLGAIFVVIRFTYSAIGHRNVVLDKRRVLRVVGITLLATAAVIVTCESLVAFPIERIHFIKYGTLAFCFYFSQKRKDTSSKLLVAALWASSIGCIEEAMQYFHPDRFFDLRDILLNVSASVFGTIYAWVVVLWKRLLIAGAA